MLRLDDPLRNKQFGGLLQSLLLLFGQEFGGHIDLIKINRVPDLTGEEHVVHGGEHHSGNSDDGAFLASAFGDALVLDAVVRGTGRLHGGVGRLNKGGLEVNTCPGDANGFLLTGGLIIAGGQAGPGAQTL